MVTKYNEYQNQRESVPKGAASGTSLDTAAEGEATASVSPAEILKEQKKVKDLFFVHLTYSSKSAVVWSI